MATDREDEGFEALLKPIQDLTRNWEFDLSLHLEEYMNYIRQMYGDNIPDMNFAQAAVLVQNSANIYSKKVDFLFTTVLQLLDTLSKKQRMLGIQPEQGSPRKWGSRKEAKNQENQDDDAGQPNERRRKPAAVLETEEFVYFDELCSDRVTSSNLDKEKAKVTKRPKQKIVLNAAIKVKAKEKTSCNVYHCGHDVMGKKEEFRLHWRICSAGTLHEEFVIKKSRFKSMDPLEITVCVPTALDESHHDYDAPCSPLSDGGLPIPDEAEPVPPLVSTLFPAGPIERESEEGKGLASGKLRKEAEKIMDVNILDWAPNDFNANTVTEKPIKKRKVVKLPPGLDDEKRKHFQENLVFSFTITDVFVKKCKNTSLGRDLELYCQNKVAAQQKRQLLQQHRAKYQAYMEREAGIDQVEDFHGFYNEEQDSDNEHDFEGFDGPHDDDDCGPEVDIPPPDKDNIMEPLSTDPGWKGDDVNTYDNEALRTLEAYRSRKIDHGRITDMARRVEEWHQKITPKLMAAEERSSFDIHAYGGKVLESFSEEIGSIKPFEDIVAGQPREEVARYFLATLVLANQYNVEITETQPGDLNVDCVQLKLLSVVRHHEELDDNMRQTSDK
ncbi:condensin-2 complex subunit H2-like isoform X2 [Homalodisca vitripennis]|uniref:condensin-2 complex subunit H2-like isoform X2 n=1 Tax=Homalodisca vitripennis TaxID=197043 RepID=UPI001EEB4246|nr:condensin-2 complex subunit H2-like isoform X2 [Homalodisca vitripennis]